MIEPIAEPTDVNCGRRMHPALRRRILTTSPNPALQVQACWDALADQTERLESIFRTIAAHTNGSESNDDTASPRTASQQIAHLAASGLRLVRALMVNYAHDDVEAEHLSKIVPRLLSNISILLTALSQSSGSPGHRSS